MAYMARTKCAKESGALRTMNRHTVTRLTANCKGYLQIFCTGVSKNPSSDMLIMSRRRRHACKQATKYYAYILLLILIQTYLKLILQTICKPQNAQISEFEKVEAAFKVKTFPAKARRTAPLQLDK